MPNFFVPVPFNLLAIKLHQYKMSRLTSLFQQKLTRGHLSDISQLGRN